eukprot:9494851-Pyramimonas_sp.AAC.2
MGLCVGWGLGYSPMPAAYESNVRCVCAGCALRVHGVCVAVSLLVRCEHRMALSSSHLDTLHCITLQYIALHCGY